MTNDNQQATNAVIYCRVSSKSQEEEGHGLESQETRCRQHAEMKGYEVAAVFPDTITGGGDFMKRPGMVALLSFLDAQPKERFVVIFDDLKRFARDTRFHLDLRDAFRKRAAAIECLNFKFDDTPEGEFVETIMAAQGALERKQNGRQVAQKMQARMENGYWIHNAPVGYRFETRKGHGKILVPHETFASIVRNALEGFASGRFQSQAEVKRFLELHADYPHLRNGHLRQQRVTDLLKHPIYTGHICSERYGLNWLKGQHEALISVATFDKVQKRRENAALAPARKNIGDDFALRGFVTCGDCEAPLRSSWSKGEFKHYAYYLCQTKGCPSYGKSIPRDKLEGEFGEIVKTLQPSASLITVVKTMFRDIWDERKRQADDMLAAAKRDIKAADKQIEALLERILGASSPAVISAYETKIGDLEASKARLRDQLDNREVNQANFNETLELSIQFLANPWKLWETGQITLRRMVLRLAFSDRLAYHRNEGARTPKIALPFKALRDIQQGEWCYGAQERMHEEPSLSGKHTRKIALDQQDRDLAPVAFSSRYPAAAPRIVPRVPLSADALKHRSGNTLLKSHYISYFCQLLWALSKVSLNARHLAW